MKKPQKMDLYCQAVEQAAETWETVKQLPNYEELVGELLFREIFEIAPAALHLYSFGGDKEISQDNKVPSSVFASPAFLAHAKGVVAMLECVITMMLGQDMERLATSLHALGSRHVDYGVHPAHYSVVETALLRTLAGALGDQWTEDVKRGWAAVFKFISKAMMSGAGAELQIIKDRRRMLERNKSATLRLKVIGNSNGISRLSRSGVSTVRSRHSQPKTRNTSPSSDPPRMPSRGGRGRRRRRGSNLSNHSGSSSDGSSSGARVSRRWSDLSPFREDDELTASSSEEDSRFREMAVSPRTTQPCRQAPLPDIIVFHKEGRMRSQDKDKPDGHSDQAPKKPTRLGSMETEENGDSFLVCKVEKNRVSQDNMEMTVDSTSTYDDELLVRENDTYWREELIKVVHV
ncbi:symbiotic hemoglobin 2 [Seminavis robusta]|uniref:Symbiotic hemoglobin 2 n=1 Tax=Seminavis robusta TaxID=568900 RepID=A0A9N8E9A0_9STRA|nr:symbiotic hemoglobin 2 [Seminavis robusta]|eukprot:Sro690_g187570.1 symbiotic hemoglobin 2 (404) ;mRNA; f:10383-11686